MNYGAKYRLAEPFQYLEDNLVFFAPYSGNAPYQTNFLGSPHSMKGQIGTQTGGVLYRPGLPRYDGLTSKAVSLREATTNMWTNPSIETNTTGYAALLGATLTRVAGISEFGAYSLETVTPGAAGGEGWQTPTGILGIAVVAAQDYTFSLYLQGSGTVTQRITWYTAAGAFISNTDQAVTLQLPFTRSCLVATAPALAAFAALTVMTNAIQAITFYADAVQFENHKYATEYCDGSLGTGFAWTGAAHASTSTGAASRISYNNLSTLNDIQQRGTFSFWIKTDTVMENGLEKGAFGIIDSSGNAITMTIRMGVTYDYLYIIYGTATTPISTPEGLLNYGEYNHIAFSFDGRYVKYYVNGVYINTYTIGTTGFANNFTSMYIGETGAGAFYFDGCIDDFMIFDRVLTEGEIKEINHFGYSIGAYESDTCNYDPAFVVNAHNKANITHIYIRSNAGVWSNNLMTEPLPFLLQPPAPAIGDAIYFGCDTLALDSGFFNNIIFNYEAAGSQTGSWQYWNGAWVAVANLQDVTSALDENGDGKNSVSWTPEAGWVPVLLSTAIAGAPASAPTGYWVRLLFTAVSATPSLELDYYPYSNTWPYFDVCDTSIEGDYEALMKFSEQQMDVLYTEAVLVGSRLLDRGSEFDGFFNCCDEQNSSFVTVGLSSASAAFANSDLAATGRAITYAPGAVAIDEDVFYIRVMNNNYQGIYRLMLFARATADSDANFRVELRPYLTGYTSYNIAYSQWKTITSFGTQKYIDLGQITIPEDIGKLSTVNGFDLVVHVDKNDTNVVTWTFFTLLVIPNDELAIEVFDDNVNPSTDSPACDDLNYINIDSAEEQKLTIKSEAWSTTAKLGAYRSISRGAAQVAPRQSFRFWHTILEHLSLQYKYIDTRFWKLMKVYLYDAERYIGLRGDR